MNLPVVTIVGRPNVGKSTLFNRLIGRRQAIVDDKPGVTRDRNFAEADWCGQGFLLVDTGGYLPKSKNVIDNAVKEQVEIAIEESDVIVFLVDARTGITTIDDELSHLLINSDRDVLLVVNKVDSTKDELEVGQFYKLGLGEPVPVSAMIGRQTGDFLDKVVEKLAKKPLLELEDDAIKLAVIGKENVGKSSFVNTLLNQDRQIVTEIPGTTRDSIDARFHYQKREYLIIDTAGLKKRTKIKENILFYSNLRTYRSIKRCDVVLYLIDAKKGLTKQDIQILLEASKERKGIICVFNKWDLVNKDHRTMDVQVYENRKKRIPTSEINDFFKPILAKTTPPAVRGKEIRIKYITQVKTNPPVFVFYSNYANLIADHYKRYIENRLREKFGFSGVPIILSFRDKK
jgi:GTP-binding protein